MKFNTIFMQLSAFRRGAMCLGPPVGGSSFTWRSVFSGGHGHWVPHGFLV